MIFFPDKWRPVNFCKAFVRRTSGLRVYSGPFRGLKYINESIGSAYYPKLLGTYEKELQEIVGTVHGHVDVIGAGEGYYAVGLAASGCTVNAYESDLAGQSAISEMAVLNDASDHVRIHGTCNPGTYTPSGGYVLMDIEGQELEFLHQGAFDSANQVTWMVEVHSNAIRHAFEEKLRGQFVLQFIPVKARTARDFPMDPGWFLRFVFGRYWKSLVQEWRSDSIGWLVLTPYAR